MENGLEHLHESSDSSSVSDNEVEIHVQDIFTLTEEEISELRRNGEFLKRFCERLKLFKSSQQRKEIAYIKEIVKRLTEKSGRLQQLIKDFLPQRRDLLKMLNAYAEKMDKVTKICSAGKLISSVVDSVGVLGSFASKQNNSFYINFVFDIANAAGLFGFASSAAELIVWRKILGELIIEIQKDQDNFESIQEFFLQYSQLEEALQVIFPFRVTAHILKEFEMSAEKELSSMELLHSILGALLKEDPLYIKNAALIQNLIDFTDFLAARYLCRWIFLRHHKVTFNVARIMLQLNSPQKLVTSQNVGTLTRFSSNSEILATIGRMGFNCMNIYNSVCTLRNGGIVEEIRKLERHLKQEMDTLIQIKRQIELSEQN